jgi:hypothetical protein
MALPIMFQSYPNFIAALTLADSADYDGAGVNVVSLVTGPASGTREVLAVQITPLGSITQGNIVRFYKFLSAGTKMRIGQIRLDRLSIDAKSEIPDIIWVPKKKCTLANGDTLKFSQEIADSLQGEATCGDYQ